MGLKTPEFENKEVWANIYVHIMFAFTHKMWLLLF